MTIDEAILDEIQKRNQPMDRDRALNILQNGLLPQVHGAYHEALKMAIKALEQEPCDDAISRQAVLDMMQMRMGAKELYRAVYYLPSVQPEQKTGRWIAYEVRLPDRTILNYRCSVCGRKLIGYNTETLSEAPFCHCGAKMKESEDHE